MSIEAFDAVAEDYDRSFTDLPLGRALRQIIWRHLEEVFPPGSRVWELNCGTGEDALWLAGRGVRVRATDGSRSMLELAARKAAARRYADFIEFSAFDCSTATPAPPPFEFDGALSNFGGLNCVRDLSPLARALAQRIRPGGRLIVVMLGRWCAWEILWYLAHLEPHGAEAAIGNRKVRVWYPSPGRLRSVFAPEFKLKRIVGVGVFLPPSYLQAGFTHRNRLLRLLRRLEELLASSFFLRRFGDHILFDYERIPAARESK